MVSKVVFCSSRCLYMKTNNNPASRFSSDFLLLLPNFTNVSVCRNIYIFPMGKAEPPTIAVHANRNTQEYNQVRPTIDNAAANVKESKKNEHRILTPKRLPRVITSRGRSLGGSPERRQSRLCLSFDL